MSTLKTIVTFFNYAKTIILFNKCYFFYSLLILVLLSFCNRTSQKPTDTLPIDFLRHYVSEIGPDFTYEISDSIIDKKYTLYHIKMTSGKWLTEAEVNQTLWWHWLDVVVPDEIASPDALLFIGGGSSNDNKIYLDSMAIAQSLKTQSVIAHISNVPFQPLNYKGTDSIDRYEDDIIAYGYHLTKVVTG